jgi:hypothetical protein
MTVVAIAEIAEASLANYGSLAGSFHVPAEGTGALLIDAANYPEEPRHFGNSINHNPLPLCTITALLGH